MIIVGRDMKGSKLLRNIIHRLQTDGYAEVAALSEMGAKRVAAAGQKLANVLGRKVVVDPTSGEVDLGNGEYRVALIAKFTFETEVKR